MPIAKTSDDVKAKKIVESNSDTVPATCSAAVPKGLKPMNKSSVNGFNFNDGVPRKADEARAYTSMNCKKEVPP